MNAVKYYSYCIFPSKQSQFFIPTGFLLQNKYHYLFGLRGAGSGHGGNLGGLELPAVAVNSLLPVHCLNMAVQLCFSLKLDITTGAAGLVGGHRGRGRGGGG